MTLLGFPVTRNFNAQIGVSFKKDKTQEGSGFGIGVRDNLRVKQNGDQYTFSYSDDGQTWTDFASELLYTKIPDQAELFLVVYAGNDSGSFYVWFSNLMISK